MNKKRVAKIPYEGYTLPPSAEKGGQFVDFKRIVERKPVKVVKRRKDSRDYQVADMLSGFLFGLGFGIIIGNYLI